MFAAQYLAQNPAHAPHAIGHHRLGPSNGHGSLLLGFTYAAHQTVDLLIERREGSHYRLDGGHGTATLLTTVFRRRTPVGYFKKFVERKLATAAPSTQTVHESASHYIEEIGGYGAPSPIRGQSLVEQLRIDVGKHLEAFTFIEAYFIGSLEFDNKGAQA